MVSESGSLRKPRCVRMDRPVAGRGRYATPVVQNFRIDRVRLDMRVCADRGALVWMSPRPAAQWHKTFCSAAHMFHFSTIQTIMCMAIKLERKVLIIAYYYILLLPVGPWARGPVAVGAAAHPNF